jgi:hypothetical protein
MRVEKREFAWEFSQFSCLGQTRTRVAWELTRVEKREFAWEFSQLSYPGQTRTRVAWELRSESLHESFLNSHAPVKREQELYESWEARVCMRVSSTLMPRSNENKSCMRVEKREFAWEISQFSCPGQTRTRVAWELRSESLHDSWWELRSESLHESSLNSHGSVKREQELHESWWELTRYYCTCQMNKFCHQLSLNFEPAQRWWESMRVGGETLDNFHPRLSGTLLILKRS